ncbi:PCMD domain-containing protein [Parvicella tangerina]|uniref:T9SS C-terminal target domain-containing protein n=1 Tax=Parvicella tangerina TaxID=2829795 RepID=A0A916JL93_9FLAO|nr:PCMD domain-containing protein [Parvicella tangerina]CAG5080174.1 hypothetical protein CRYO30217_01208 [Parvicella tangerina]
MKKHLFYLFTLAMIGSNVAQQQFENAGFETWENDSGPYIEPTDWSSIKTSDNSFLNSSAPQVQDRSTDAHTGSYSLYVENKSAFGIVANGIVSNGRIHADVNPENGYVFTDGSDAQWNTPFTSRPDSLVGWYKYTPSGGDHGKVDVILHTGSSFDFPDDENGPNQVGRARFNMPNATIGSWTRFSVPFHYNTSSSPAYILAVLTSGDSTQAVNGSKAWFDDIELIYNPVSVEELQAENFTVSSLQNGLKLWGGSGLNANISVQLIDLQGREVATTNWSSYEDYVWQLNELSGIYLLRFHVADKMITKKVFIE